MANPLIAQGTLNRVRCHIVVPSLTSLNITASYMVKNFATVNFGGSFVDQMPTGTGVVNSPAPYVMATISCGLIRSQSLAQEWLTQAQSTSILGNVTIYSDTSAWDPVQLRESAIMDIQPGPYDGMDPTVSLTISGVYDINNNLWNGL